MKTFNYEKAIKEGFYLKDRYEDWYVRPENFIFDLIEKAIDEVLTERNKEKN